MEPGMNKEGDDEGGFMRAPLMTTFRRKSPFDGLLEHAEKMKECLRVLEKLIHAYLDGNMEKVHELTKKVSEIENEADIIKGNTRNHLPNWIFMPVDRGDFLLLLHDMDSILDNAENVAELMDMKQTAIPEEMKDDFRRFAAKVLETGEALEEVMMEMKDLLETSFSSKEREKAKELIHKVHRKEWEADGLQRVIVKKLYNTTELDPISVFHLMNVVEDLDKIADKAENSADRIRAMMGK